jgi:hypothetical protein
MEQQNETIAPDERRFSRRSTVSSPRTWGCTAKRHRGCRELEISSPRTWGCTVSGGGYARSAYSSSPRTWGCTGRAGLALLIPTHVGVHRASVLRNVLIPTHVGVHRAHAAVRYRRPHPHARGGAPSSARDRVVRDLIPTHVGVHRLALTCASASLPSSPRTWGCTGGGIRETRDLQLIPTHVGVHRKAAAFVSTGYPHPHARGGAPYAPLSRNGRLSSSPRTWGCTATRPLADPRAALIPTHVGVHRWRHPGDS